MWLQNNQTGEWTQVNGFSNACTHNQILSAPTSFLTTKIRLIKTGWDWSATDAVQLCGET
jgi:hypothetical protein